MSPAKDSSSPQIDAFALGEMLGEMRASLRRIEEWQQNAPCAARGEQLAKLDADVRRLDAAASGHRVSHWLATNWKLVVPLLLAMLSAPTVRQCFGEQHAAKIAEAVQRLEQRPATKVIVAPMPQPIVVGRPDVER